MSLSLLLVLGRDGMERVIELPLSEDEREALWRSAEALKRELDDFQKIAR
jgi:malate/lactate dehydrogenase